MENNPRKYLFVCSANIDRSKTGEIVFGDMLKERGYSVGKLEESLERDFYVGSAGINATKYGNQDSVQYTKEMGNLADVILVAHEEIVDVLNILDSDNKHKFVDLNIADDYDTEHERDYRELVKIFKEKLLEYMPKK